MTNIVKINWLKDTYYDNGKYKLKNTNLPLDGKYENENENETILYFKNGKRHNENGPAYIGRNGYEAYCINGKAHRIDGPAMFYPNGYHEWWINDYYIEKAIIDDWLTENNIPLDWNIWTNEDKMLFALHWGDYEG